jgi:hypothetical protein
MPAAPRRRPSPRDPGARPPPEPPADLFDALMSQFVFIVATRYPDADAPDGELPDVAIQATDRDGNTHRIVKATPREAALAILGREQQAKCQKCRKHKPPGEFARCKDNPSGRLYRCKTCERERVRLWQQKRRAKRKGGPGKGGQTGGSHAKG